MTSSDGPNSGTNDGQGKSGQMIRRAQAVAMGFAETGLTQAEEMLRRLSPEGRAQAQREREARARRRQRLMVRLMFAALASLAVLVLLGQVIAPALSILAAMAVMVALTTLIVSNAAPRAPGREALVGAKLAALPAETSLWLAAQRRGLPAPAVQLTDTLARRLDDLAPQLARLDPHEPAADAMRNLISVELPRLVEGWRAVPPSLRDVPHADGSSPNAQLVHGLELIDEEVARATEELARGARDEVATQGRYLTLKYRSFGLKPD